jgi:SAM-dependent methyltransferase
MFGRNLYSRQFFARIGDHSEASARALVPLILDIHPARSVVDVGCGIGTWVKAFADRGLTAVGIDGDYVDRNQLVISEGQFIPHDLNRELGTASAGRRLGGEESRFDLAMHRRNGAQ